MYDYFEYLEKVNSLKKVYNQAKTDDADYYNSDDEDEDLCSSVYAPQVPHIPPYNISYNNNLINANPPGYKWHPNKPPSAVTEYCTCDKKSYTKTCVSKNIKNYEYCKYQKKKKFVLAYLKPCPKIIVYNNYINKKTCAY